MKRWMAVILIAALMCISMAGCGNSGQQDWHSGMEGGSRPAVQAENPSDNGNVSGETSADDSQEQAMKEPDGIVETKPADGELPTENRLVVNQVTEDCYERLLAAGILIGLSVNYPDFELEELCFKKETSLANKMDSEGVYAFFQSGGEKLCVYAAPLAEPRTEDGTCDLMETTLGYASFDLKVITPSELVGYISLMDEDLSEQINQLYLLTIIEN